MISRDSDRVERIRSDLKHWRWFVARYGKRAKNGRALWMGAATNLRLEFADTA